MTLHEVIVQELWTIFKKDWQAAIKNVNIKNYNITFYTFVESIERPINHWKSSIYAMFSDDTGKLNIIQQSFKSV